MKKILVLIAVVALICPGCSDKKEKKEKSVLQEQFDTQNRAVVERTKGSMNKVAMALSAYLTDNGQYPTETNIQELASKLATYDSAFPSQDAWHRDFVCSSTGNSYELTSSGMDGKIGTEDDLVMKDGQFTQLPKSFRRNID